MIKKIKLSKKNTSLYIYTGLFIVNIIILFFLSSFIKEYIYYPINVTNEELKMNINTSTKKINSKLFDEAVKNLNYKMEKPESIKNIFQ